MFKSLLLFFSMMVVLVSCADSSGTYDQVTGEAADEYSAIIGGKEAAPRSPLTNRVLSLIVTVPLEPMWQEGSLVPVQTRTQCTAIPIAKRVILTAAHCASANSAARYSLYVPNESGQTVQIAVLNKKIHDRYRLKDDNYDLMLLSVEKDLPANIEMARLPEYRDQIKPTYINAAGFGKSVGTASSEKGVGTLRITTLAVNNYGDREAKFEVDQTNGKGICQGDSGGPAFAQFQGKTYLVGVVSKSLGRERSDNIHRDICNQAGYFIKIDNNLTWIREYTAALSSGQPLKRSLVEHIFN